MTYIKTNINQPGIVELLFYKGSTGRALSSLADTLLVGPSPLSSADRETIAAYVSYLNNCEFCHLSHKAAAIAHAPESEKNIECLKENFDTTPLSLKLKTLLRIAASVQQSGKAVTQQHIDTALQAGASDEEIHDTVLIAAAFCMFNRYVDGLNTNLPQSKSEYEPMGKRMAKGYKMPPAFMHGLVAWMVNLRGKKSSKN